MKDVLVVNEPFGQYQRGDRIEDPEAIKAVLESENAHFVVRSQVPVEPAPKSKK
jgi:hypothetical protein